MVDSLILLGDYVDRGPNSKEVIEQVKSLKEADGVIALRGNHDQMMLDALLEDTVKRDGHWLRNGAYATIGSYLGHPSLEEIFDWKIFAQAKKLIMKEFKHHIDFLNELEYFYETDTHIFIHAGINPSYSDWKQQPNYDSIWIRDEFYMNPTGLQKTVVFGHTSTINLHESADIWFSPMGDKIGIDGGCAYGKQINCLEILEGGEYITHFVRSGEG